MTGYARGASQQSTVCRLCTVPMPLETSKTDEHGKAVHEQCYVRKMISRDRRGSAIRLLAHWFGSTGVRFHLRLGATDNC
jgi:hypothetical protein